MSTAFGLCATTRRSASEQAGQKQRLLAVIRRESFDTLENRVTLDFCRRSRQAVRSYKEQNAKFAAFDPEKQTGSKRLAKVLNYGKYCESYLGDSVWDGVSALAEPCRTPNYALAQNPLYVEVWREYLKLLRYANLREAVCAGRAWPGLISCALLWAMAFALPHAEQAPFAWPSAVAQRAGPSNAAHGIEKADARGLAVRRDRRLWAACT